MENTTAVKDTKFKSKTFTFLEQLWARLASKNSWSTKKGTTIFLTNSERGIEKCRIIRQVQTPLRKFKKCLQQKSYKQKLAEQ